MITSYPRFTVAAYLLLATLVSLVITGVFFYSDKPIAYLVGACATVMLGLLTADAMGKRGKFWPDAR